MATMPRSVRVPGDLWNAAVVKASREGTTVTSVVVAALVAYVTDEKPIRQSKHKD